MVRLESHGFNDPPNYKRAGIELNDETHYLYLGYPRGINVFQINSECGKGQQKIQHNKCLKLTLVKLLVTK